jgi:hypothetical protein
MTVHRAVSAYMDDVGDEQGSDSDSNSDAGDDGDVGDGSVGNGQRPEVSSAQCSSISSSQPPLATNGGEQRTVLFHL